MAAILVASRSCYCTHSNLTFSSELLDFQSGICSNSSRRRGGHNRLLVKMVKTPSSTVTSTDGYGIKRNSRVKLMLKRHNSNKQPAEQLKVLESDESFMWANESYNFLRRSIDIWLFVLSLQVRILLEKAKWLYPGGFTEDKQMNRRWKTAAWLRERILQLGPTFIKLGQFFSTRSDLLPPEFVDELAKLQDKVPAFSPEKAKRFIESELGAPIDQLFKTFEETPIAAASLGQVHRAILHNGEKVVVKVQRPGLKNLFDIDLRNLKIVVEYFERSETFGGYSRDWSLIYEECSTLLYQEIDYINEGKNADRFRRDFRNMKWIRVPLVFWDYTAPKVLTLEYLPGTKISHLDAIDLGGLSRSQIASRTIEAYLIQILKNGFFHADPHPGNLAVGADNSLIYYDFGMMGEVQSSTRERLLQLFYAVYEKDDRKVINTLMDLEVIQPQGDLSSVKKAVQYFLDNSLSERRDQQKTLAAFGQDLFAIIRDQPCTFPSTFTFILKAFSTLEGIGCILDPNFSFVKVAEPYAQELLDIRQDQLGGLQLVEEIRKRAIDARSSTISMPYRVQQVEQFVKRLEVGDVKLQVRAVESERAARKATMLQMATMYAVYGGNLLTLAVTFSSQDSPVIANGSFVGAGVLFTLFLMSMQKVKRLGKH